MYHQSFSSRMNRTQNSNIMRTHPFISILLVVATTFLSSCTLLCSSPLPRSRQHIHHYSEEVSYTDANTYVGGYSYSENSSSQMESTVYIYSPTVKGTPTYCQAPGCSCRQYKAQKCRCSMPNCTCGHKIENHFIRK